MILSMVITRATAWGDVPTWLGAVGTVAAAWIALVIYAQSQRERRRAQARSVSGWVPGGVGLIPAGLELGSMPFTADHDRVALMIAVRNGSGEIISDVNATVVSVDGHDVGAAPVGWTDIGPGQSVELQSYFADTGDVRGEVRLKLQFTDSAGQRWERLGSSLRRM